MVICVWGRNGVSARARRFFCRTDVESVFFLNVGGGSGDLGGLGLLRW